MFKGEYNMLQVTNSEIILQESPNIEKKSIIPVVQLASGFIIDDSILEKPTLMIGQVSSGKSFLLRNTIIPQIISSLSVEDAVVIFATKREMIDGLYNSENGLRQGVCRFPL